MRALSANEVATELGRSLDWLYANWRREAKENGMPEPLHEGGSLVWNAAQFYAWLDRDLPADLKASAAAFRAAATAYATAPDPADDAELERWRARLDRFKAAS